MQVWNVIWSFQCVKLSTGWTYARIQLEELIGPSEAERLAGGKGPDCPLPRLTPHFRSLPFSEGKTLGFVIACIKHPRPVFDWTS